MRNVVLASLCCVLLTFSPSAAAHGQPPGHGWKGGPDSCLSLDELDLSPEQRSEVMEISGPCRNHLLLLRTELVGKRLELKRMLRDPSISEEEIEEAWKEIEVLNVSMYREVKNYTLSIRRVLTPEQVSDWCALVEVYPRRGRR